MSKVGWKRYSHQEVRTFKVGSDGDIVGGEKATTCASAYPAGTLVKNVSGAITEQNLPYNGSYEAFVVAEDIAKLSSGVPETGIVKLYIVRKPEDVDNLVERTF